MDKFLFSSSEKSLKVSSPDLLFYLLYALMALLAIAGALLSVTLLWKVTCLAIKKLGEKEKVAYRPWLTRDSRLCLTDEDGNEYQTLVLSVEPNAFAALAPMESGELVTLHPGADYQVVLTAKDGLYRFHTEIIKRQAGIAPAFFFALPWRWEHEQRRRFSRLAFETPLFVRLCQPCLRCPLEARLLDLSQKGACLQTSDAFTKGELLEVKGISLEGFELPSLEAKVIQCEPHQDRFVTRLSFFETPQEERLLAELLESTAQSLSFKKSARKIGRSASG